MNRRPCSTCEFHKSKNNKTPGVMIPEATGKCTRPGGLCEEPTATRPESKDPQSILAHPDVQDAIAKIADTDEAYGLLQERAVEAVSSLMEIARDNDQQAPGEEDCIYVALKAVSSLDRGDSSLATYHAINDTSGNRMPSGFRLSWEPTMEEAKALIPEITEERGAQLTANANALAVADQAVMDAEEVHRALGRIEGMEFLRHVGDVAIAQVFADVRKSKRYKGLPYKDAEGNVRHVGTFEEFCDVKLGKSYKRCHELAQNLHVLGTDLYESAERIGFRSRDYRALKALPEADQDAVKTALDEGSTKEEVLDLLSDMAERHAAEKAASKKELADLKADHDALDKLMADKTERLDKATVELTKLKSLPPAERARLWLEQEAAAAERLNLAEVKCTAAVNEFLGVLADVLEDEDISTHTSQYAHSLATYMAEQVGNLFANYGIAVNFEGIVRPEWTRDDAAHDLGVEAEG